MKLPKKASITKVYQANQFDPETAMYLISIKDTSDPLCVTNTPIFGNGLIEHITEGMEIDLTKYEAVPVMGSDGKERLWLKKKD